MPLRRAHILGAVLLATALGACRTTFVVPDPDEHPPLVPVWQRALHTDALLTYRPREYGSPAVDPQNRTVLAASRGGRLHCVKQSTGAVLWTFDTDGPALGTPLVAGSAVFFGGGDGRVYALDRKTGEPLWRAGFDTGGQLPTTPALSGGRLYVASDRNELFALDAADGKPAWPAPYRREHQGEFTHFGVGSPTVAGDLVLAGFSDGVLAALELDRAEARWTVDLSAPGSRFVDVDGTPVVVGDRVIVTSVASGLVALRLKDGQVLWKQPVDDPSAPVVQGQRIYLTTGETREVRCFDLATGTPLWTARFNYGVLSPPAVGGASLIVATTWALAVLDAKTGDILAKLPVVEGFSALPTLVPGRLFAVSNRGVLHAIDTP